MAQIRVIELWPLEGECGICNKHIFIDYFLPMYEGSVVKYPKRHEWGGTPVCKECHDKHEVDWET